MLLARILRGGCSLFGWGTARARHKLHSAPQDLCESGKPRVRYYEIPSVKRITPISFLSLWVSGQGTEGATGNRL